MGGESGSNSALRRLIELYRWNCVVPSLAPGELGVLAGDTAATAAARCRQDERKWLRGPVPKTARPGALPFACPATRRPLAQNSRIVHP